MAKWRKAFDPPHNEREVLLKVRYTHKIMQGAPPVIFQGKHERNKGWSDHAGDFDKEADWEVLEWMEIPGKFDRNNKIPGFLEEEESFLQSEFDKLISNDLFKDSSKSTKSDLKLAFIEGASGVLRRVLKNENSIRAMADEIGEMIKMEPEEKEKLKL